MVEPITGIFNVGIGIIADSSFVFKVKNRDDPAGRLQEVSVSGSATAENAGDAIRGANSAAVLAAQALLNKNQELIFAGSDFIKPKVHGKVTLTQATFKISTTAKVSGSVFTTPDIKFNAESVTINSNSNLNQADEPVGVALTNHVILKSEKIPSIAEASLSALDELNRANADLTFPNSPFPYDTVAALHKVKLGPITMTHSGKSKIKIFETGITKVESNSVGATIQDTYVDQATDWLQIVKPHIFKRCTFFGDEQSIPVRAPIVAGAQVIVKSSQLLDQEGEKLPADTVDEYMIQHRADGQRGLFYWTGGGGFRQPCVVDASTFLPVGRD